MAKTKAKEKIPNEVTEKKDEYITPVEADSTKTTTIATREEKARGPKAKPLLEKSSPTEKETGPIITLQYVDHAGNRKTKIFTCSQVKLSEYRDQTLGKSGTKTILNINLEASVLEVSG